MFFIFHYEFTSPSAVLNHLDNGTKEQSDGESIMLQSLNDSLSTCWHSVFILSADLRDGDFHQNLCLFLVAVVTNYQRLSDLKEQPGFILQFWGSEA